MSHFFVSALNQLNVHSDLAREAAEYIFLFVFVGLCILPPIYNRRMHNPTKTDSCTLDFAKTILACCKGIKEERKLRNSKNKVKNLAFLLHFAHLFVSLTPGEQQT